ncbi:chemotaxis response regulator protein-glutamate methylesterase [Thalassorhabdus alkalitolerans]|uniref:Protein-glutamate methylesterase/protein-glutamine glutaminase n=1 Tax=Thalassorhabdus alkalitolerans TaxID=2282697 RepID=A0ABW0YL64_9BACI
MIRVLVVDDSAFMRKVISDAINRNEDMTVAATARNGAETIEKLRYVKVNVITLDVEMPQKNGLDTLKEIMEEFPHPVVMVSSATQEGALQTIAAMELGAVDFVAKPSGPISLDFDLVRKELIEKIKIASEAFHQSILTKEKKVEITRSPPPLHPSNLMLKKKVIAIGTSTGGPRALQQLFSDLPGTLAAPLLIVQHMPAGFTQSLAKRLNDMSELTVKEAEDGEVARNGVAYIAPGGKHVTVKNSGEALVLNLLDTPPQNNHKPSVDTLFTSLADIAGYSVVAVIMTGMGADGAVGIQKLKEKKSNIALAESEGTSTVFGMPKAAAQTGQIDEVVPLFNMSKSIRRYIEKDFS